MIQDYSYLGMLDDLSQVDFGCNFSELTVEQKQIIAKALAEIAENIAKEKCDNQRACKDNDDTIR